MDKELDTTLLDDAVKTSISMRGQALLQWTFIKRSDGAAFPYYSIQLPEDVIDLILLWRDKAKLDKAENP